jgi:hypothetical protein
MSEASSPNVTQLLVAWSKGDQHAFDALMPEVRKELHRLAAHYMAEEPPGHDLQPTALINENQKLLFSALGTPEADKKLLLLEGGHRKPETRPELVSEIIGWFDHYLGLVKER